MAAVQVLDDSTSEGASSEDDWIQNDEDADSIGDEDLDIYGDDFDSEEEDHEEAKIESVIERDRQKNVERAAWPQTTISESAQTENQQVQENRVDDELAAPSHTVLAWDAHQAIDPSHGQRRSRPSDTQRLRPPDTRRRPGHSIGGGLARPESRHVRTEGPAHAQRSDGAFHTNMPEGNHAQDEPIRQIFRGVSHGRIAVAKDLHQSTLLQMSEGSAKWERAHLLGEEEHDAVQDPDEEPQQHGEQRTESDIELVKHADRENLQPTTDVEEVQVRAGIDSTIPSKVEEMQDWGLVTSIYPSRPPSSIPDVDPHVRLEKELPNWLERVQATYSGESSKNDDMSEEDLFPGSEGVEPVPLKLTATHQTFSLSTVGQYGLSPVHRTRINGYLGITESAPKPVVVEKESPPVAPFIAIMFQIVSDPRNWHCVCWGGDGNTLLFTDPTTFGLRLIPRYFSGTWRSKCGSLNGTAYDFPQVVRMLRIYGFRKVDPDDPDRMEFQQRCFRQDSTLLHRLAPRRGSRCISASSAHKMLLPRPWTPLRARVAGARPTTAPGSSVQPQPPATPRGPSAGRRAQSATGRTGSQDLTQTQTADGAGASVQENREGEGGGRMSAETFLGGRRSKFQYLRREQIRREAAIAEKGWSGGAGAGERGIGGRLVSVVKLAAAAHGRGHPLSERARSPQSKASGGKPRPSPLRTGSSGRSGRGDRTESTGSSLWHSAASAGLHSVASGRRSSVSSGGAASPRSRQSPTRSPRARSPTVRGRNSNSPSQMVRTKSALQARRRANGEVLVGLEDGGVVGTEGLRVRWSEEGVEHKVLDGSAMGWWAQAVGVITEVETDGRMCLVQWQSGEEEWCCTGFSDKYYLQKFVVKQFQKAASTWRKEARLAPQWTWVNENGVWRMNRLKSQINVNMTSLKWEAEADKLLPSVKRMVARHYQQHRAEVQRQQEATKVKLKMQRRMQRAKASRPDPCSPKRTASARGSIVMEERSCVPEIDNVESVGEFVRCHGPMDRIVSLGMVSQLGRVLRKAYGDMEKQPSGNLKHQEVLMAVQKMRLSVSPQQVTEVLKQHDREDSGEVTLDEFLDCMYHLLQRIVPHKPTSPLSSS